MDKRLVEMIEQARLELRIATGIPLSTEEMYEESRRIQLEELDTFICFTFKGTALYLLHQKTLWTESGVAGKFETDGKVFYLRRHERDYALFAVNAGGEERLLLSLAEKDPQFANRVLVTIGERVSS